MSTAIQQLQSPQAIAKLKNARVIQRSEIETFNSEVVKQVLEKFGDLIHAYAQTPEGLAASDHAMDWQWEPGFLDEKRTQETKDELEGLWQGMNL